MWSLLCRPRIRPFGRPCGRKLTMAYSGTPTNCFQTWSIRVYLDLSYICLIFVEIHILLKAITLSPTSLLFHPLPPSKRHREGVRVVIAALESSRDLRRLSLAGCQLNGDGGQAIIAAMGSGLLNLRSVKRAKGRPGPSAASHPHFAFSLVNTVS